MNPNTLCYKKERIVKCNIFLHNLLVINTIGKNYGKKLHIFEWLVMIELNAQVAAESVIFWDF